LWSPKRRKKVISKIIDNGKYPIKSTDRGFTLVEILVTFVLIALIIPVAMEGISLATKLGTKSKQEIKAGTLAETKLAAFLLSGDWSSGDQSGQFEGDDSEYRWKLEVKDWEEQDSMKQLNMAVEWTDPSGVNHSVALSTVVYSESESG
jgi:prepilin-type N-terminal cleavage/methylation domain-containing protein